MGGRMNETPEQAAHRFSARAIQDGYKPDGFYTYQDADGNPLKWVIRLKHPNGDKRIWPMRLSGQGYELKEPKYPDGRPLYRLPGLLARPADPTWFLEGENKVDALKHLGVLATTSGGANCASKTDFSPLTKRRVIIWPDNDEPGLRHAREVADRLVALDATVQLVDIDELNLPLKGDVVDWLKAHPNATAEDLEALPVVDYVKAERAGTDAYTWPPPQPLIAPSQEAVYPLEALPAGIGAPIKEVVDFVQCPVSLAACSALSALSLACQGLADVRRADKLTGPCSLYLLAIAESGERKTSCDNLFVAAIRDWEREQGVLMQPEIARHEAAMQAWTVKRDGLLQAIKRAAKSGGSTAEKERELERLEADKPQPPRVPSLIYADTTSENLAFDLAHKWPSGGVISSEAGIVFGGHAMGRDSIMRSLGLLNGLWDGVRHKVGRRTSESYALQGVRLTMGLAVQPETVRAFFESSKGLARGSGFAARFLIAWPESTQGSRFFQEPPASWPLLSAFNQRIRVLLDQAPNINSKGELEIPLLDLSPQAKAAWIHFHDEVERELKPGGDMADTRDVASKAADNVARLAALFHIFEYGPSGEISAAHIHAATPIVTWHLYEAQRFLGEVAAPPVMDNAMRLDTWLIRHCREHQLTAVDTRHVQQFGPGPLRRKAALEEAVAELTEAHRARLVQEGQHRKIEVNPALLEGDHGAA